MKTIIAFMLLLFAFSSPASAQSLKLPTAVFAGAAAADWVSTARGLGTTVTVNGKTLLNHESNPMLQWAHDKPVPTVLGGVAMDVAGVYAWNRFVGRKHPKVAAVGLYAASSFRLWLVARNERVNQRTRVR